MVPALTLSVEPLAHRHHHPARRGSSGFRRSLNRAVTSRARVTMLSRQDPGADGAAGTPLFLGIDFGTSGARYALIDRQGAIHSEGKRAYAPVGDAAGWASSWRAALFQLLGDIPPAHRPSISSISIDGTSATTLIVDSETGELLAGPFLYNESFPDALPAVESIAPANHTVCSASSTLCKLVSWWNTAGSDGTGSGSAAVLMHQSDWLLWLLHGQYGVSDYNNALKVGYDPEADAYPSWLMAQPYSRMLPSVMAPGAPIAAVRDDVLSQALQGMRRLHRDDGQHRGVPRGAHRRAGESGDVAGLDAGGQARERGPRGRREVRRVQPPPGRRVARRRRVQHRRSRPPAALHRRPAGGAEQGHRPGRRVTARLLPAAEERREVPGLRPRHGAKPRPESDAEYLHGILESIARIEAKGYSLLRELGATAVEEVFTAGGGAQNEKWTTIRERVLGVPVRKAEQTEAAYGAALLALKGADRRVGAIAS
ncbi:hypothetical protein PAHAL_2G105000 [Panicum hallii]|uniref:Uncharacterized protein n=1 Tax=Panicum hallii TaxID=206008 RepID=A0A2T8KNL2_9POAL|nr:hypothetical protein PAHAL_2G105000 [Panicum hallii]